MFVCWTMQAVIADFPFKKIVRFIYFFICVKYCLNNSEDDLQRYKWKKLKPETGMSWIQYMTPQNMSDCSCPKSKMTWLQTSSDMISEWYFCDVFWLSLQFYSKGFTFIFQGTDYGSWTAKHRYSFSWLSSSPNNQSYWIVFWIQSFFSS